MYRLFNFFPQHLVTCPLSPKYLALLGDTKEESPVTSFPPQHEWCQIQKHPPLEAHGLRSAPSLIVGGVILAAVWTPGENIPQLWFHFIEMLSFKHSCKQRVGLAPVSQGAEENSLTHADGGLGLIPRNAGIPRGSESTHFSRMTSAVQCVVRAGSLITKKVACLSVCHQPRMSWPSPMDPKKAPTKEDVCWGGGWEVMHPCSPRGFAKR